MLRRRNCRRILSLQLGQKTRDRLMWINTKKVGIRAQKRDEVHFISEEAVFSFSLKRPEVLQRNPRFPLHVFQGDAFMFTRLSQYSRDSFHTLSFFPSPPTIARCCRLRPRLHK
jgi:hypothetical protein